MPREYPKVPVEYKIELNGEVIAQILRDVLKEELLPIYERLNKLQQKIDTEKDD